MTRSGSRILTTHVGSLIRPADLLQRSKAAKESPQELARYEHTLRCATVNVVEEQIKAGIDIVNDGEFGKSSWSKYVLDRVTGFELRPVSPGFSLESLIAGFRKLPSGQALIARAKQEKIEYPSPRFSQWVDYKEQNELLLKANGEYNDIVMSQRRKGVHPSWYQLIVLPPTIPILIPPTRFGTTPFDDDPFYRCPLGHIPGLNPISEITVRRDDSVKADLMCTTQMVGKKLGLLRPHPIILVSPRLRRLLVQEKVSGFKTEVAYFEESLPNAG